MRVPRTTRSVPSSWLTYGGLAGLYIASVRSRRSTQLSPHFTSCLIPKERCRTHLCDITAQIQITHDVRRSNSTRVLNAHVGVDAHYEHSLDTTGFQEAIHLAPVIRYAVCNMSALKVQFI